jgi:hypothetical protein
MASQANAVLDFGKKRLPDAWLDAWRTWSWPQQDRFFATLYFMRLGETKATPIPGILTDDDAHRFAWDTTLDALNHPEIADPTAIFRFGIAIKRPFPGSASRYY